MLRPLLQGIRTESCRSRRSPKKDLAAQRSALSIRNDEPRQRIGPGRQGFGRDRNADLRDCCLADNGSDRLAAALLPHLARAHAELGQFEEAWRCIGEAMTAAETTKEKCCEAEIHRTAGEIALMSPQPNAAQAEAYFERALAVARKQQAKSWELRAAMKGGGAIGASGLRPVICSLRCTAGSPKASIRSI